MKRSKIHRAAALTAVLTGAALTTPAAAATNATWSGASPTDTWSTGANWSGGVAPSGSVGDHAPETGACLSWACGFAVDDIPSLTVGTLQIDSGSNYLVTPIGGSDSIELLKALKFSTTKAPVPGARLLTKMVVPLSLGATQTWNIGGARRRPRPSPSDR